MAAHCLPCLKDGRQAKAEKTGCLVRPSFRHGRQCAAMVASTRHHTIYRKEYQGCRLPGCQGEYASNWVHGGHLRPTCDPCFH